jgi:uncharacterized protein YbaP (TraB family)
MKCFPFHRPDDVHAYVRSIASLSQAQRDALEDVLESVRQKAATLSYSWDWLHRTLLKERLPALEEMQKDGKPLFDSTTYHRVKGLLEKLSVDEGADEKDAA